MFLFKRRKYCEILIDNLKIIYKSLAYYTKLYYNNDKNVARDVIWLSLINAKSYDELKEMTYLIMDGKDRDKFLKDVRDASKDKFLLSEWESDKMAELVKSEGIRYAELEGFEQGREQANIDNIKAMLENNIDLNVIVKISGKSIEEIKEIERSMNN